MARALAMNLAVLAARFAKEDEALRLSDAGMTCDAIGARFGVGRARANQLVLAAFRRAKKCVNLLNPDDPRDIRFEHLLVTSRLRNCMENDGLYTLGSVLEFSERELLRIPNFGEGTLRELKDVLRDHCLSLQPAYEMADASR